ncbi:MAG: hypothetical protein Q8P61_00930 [Candidatus Nanopelagicales bacterium]|nr:hypothetical protein [Candidatus Nanopelagicales bacterium]
MAYIPQGIEQFLTERLGRAVKVTRGEGPYDRHPLYIDDAETGQRIKVLDGGSLNRDRSAKELEMRMKWEFPAP